MKGMLDVDKLAHFGFLRKTTITE